MSEVVIVSNNKHVADEVKSYVRSVGTNVIQVTTVDEIAIAIKKTDPVVVIFDCISGNADIIEKARSLKFVLQKNDVRSIALLPEKNIDYEILKYVNSYITRPIDRELFLMTVNSNLRLCETFRVISQNNNDLAKSLYQLNVLYTTGTQLAGTLDKYKLTDIIIDALDMSLSLELSYVLIFNEDGIAKLIIKSSLPLSNRLENAIKLRAILSYKNIFSLDIKNEGMVIEKNIKDFGGEFDLNVFNFDNLFAPINIKDKFYGIVEVFRKNDFGLDDTKCFTTLIKQVSLPLESAILYEEIKAANLKLEKLEKLKSEFISIVSHEIKTPLAAMEGSLDLVIKGSAGEINETAMKFLNMAKRNVTRLSAMIKDLLNLSKIEAGKMEYCFEKSNVNIPVESVKNALDAWAEEHKVKLKINLADDLDSVYADNQRIEQVINNLITNAVKFSKENSTVEITTKKITADTIRQCGFFEELPEIISDNYVCVSVKDSGIGIARENWGRIFEQFEQIENASTRKVGGSGLGIPIAKKLTDAHKGVLWLDSELNKGTTFYLALPVLNEKQIFFMSLENVMRKTAREHINTAIISFEENIIEEKSFIDKILSGDIIRKTADYQYFREEIEGKRRYYSYSPDVDSFVYDFEVCKLQTALKEGFDEYKDCELKYSTVLYPQDGTEFKGIYKKISDFKPVE